MPAITEDVLVADLVTLMQSSDLAPWRRPWSGSQGEHRNLATGQPYKGANPVLLEFGGLIRGSTLPLWIGAGQAKAQGWFPKKGSKAVRIVRPQPYQKVTKDEKGEEVKTGWVAYKAVPVFNAQDLDGGDSLAEAIDRAIGAVSNPSASQRIDHAETVLEGWAVPTTFGGLRACYSPSSDRISMPKADTFDSREAYCATWAHEQAHSTGHRSRLARKMEGAPGSKEYALEELVAELASVLVCYRLQIGCELQGHAAYLKSWATVLTEEPKILYKVLSEARKAADLIVKEE
jgi:antirestriction protein ArdC